MLHAPVPVCQIERVHEECEENHSSKSVTREIKVAVHGGDPLSRAGVVGHLALEPDMAVVLGPVFGATGSAVDVSADVAVVLVDQLDSATSTRLRKLSADSLQRVVLVVDDLDQQQLTSVLEAGIHTIVWRHQATEAQLARAIRAAHRDESDIPGDLLRRLMTQLVRRTRDTEVSTTAPGRPTPRESSVLKLVAQGLSTKEIAVQLSYSERTVKGILHDVMMRLHLRNRAHAVAHAIREGHI